MTIVTDEQAKLNTLLKDKKVGWSLIVITILIAIIDNSLTIDKMVGALHIVLYILLLLPIIYFVQKKALINPYTKWFLPLLVIMIFDMFYYNNDMVQYILPIIFYMLIIILYLTSMQNVHSLYQTLIPRFSFLLSGIRYIKEFIGNLLVKKGDKKLYRRIGLAMLITLPFLAVFSYLLMDADSMYAHYIKELFSLNINFEFKNFIITTLYFFAYLYLFVYSFSNHKKRDIPQESKVLDMLIVSIFLGLINLLFLSFIALQIPFLLSESYLPTGINIAHFAREGFFQLIMVMGLVVFIFLFIMRRFKGENIIIFFLVGLLVQTIIMGVVSLKKMYLYQSIKGATVLRYYVEWFDYFLISILLLGIFFLIKKHPFTKLLNIVTIIGVVSFTIIISLNIDAMVAKHNIEKFKDNISLLDEYAIRELSIDALPIVREAKIDLSHNKYSKWYKNDKRENCEDFVSYHFGYCSILKRYGDQDD